MARTRSKPKAAVAQEPIPEAPQAAAKPLPPSTTNPPKVFILPKHVASESRIVTLNDPANGAPSRYFFCPQKGFHEFTRIAAPKKDCKSWLITPEQTPDAASENKEKDLASEAGLGQGYLTNQADMFLATPIDILFLILPALAPKTGTKKGEKQHFLSFEDHLDTLASISRQWNVLFSQHPALKDSIERRMAAVCDTVTAGDENMYRLSNEKLAAALTKKAKRICVNGLPPSMEDRFIKSALEVPVMNVARSDAFTAAEATDTAVSQTTTTSTLTRTESDISTTTTIDSQTTITSSSTPTTSPDDLTPAPTLETPPEIPSILRLRTSLTYLTTAYLPPSLHAPIKSSPTPDFSALEAHLATLSKLRSEALALRSISDNISRKRAHAEDEGAALDREEKKRKKEEEDKKKKSASRAVNQLKKVDTSGMKKLSSFFAKAPKKA